MRYKYHYNELRLLHNPNVTLHVRSKFWKEKCCYQCLHHENVLSPVQSFTSEPTPSHSETSESTYSFILFMFDSYFLIFLIWFRSPLLPFRRPFLIFTRSLSIIPVPPLELRYPSLFLLLNSGTCTCSSTWLRTPPVYKPVVSVDTRQSDYYVLIFRIAFTCVTSD